jgi:CHAD domain-containing protein
MRLLARPRLLLRRRLRALQQQLAPAAAGEVEGIHQARVASRRLREMMPLLVAEAGGRDARALRNDLRTITRLLGPLREIDVALLTLDELTVTAPDHATAVGLVINRTAIEREQVQRRVGRALSRIDAGHLARHERALPAGLDSPEGRRRCAARSVTRLDARIAELTEALEAAGVVYAQGPLHQVRIALKKFRYALEIAADLGHFHMDASLKRLKSMQDLLGTIHDFQVLSVRVRDLEAATRAVAARRQLRALADHLDQRVRQLHSRYLDQRGELAPVLSRARRTAVALGLTGISLPE